MCPASRTDPGSSEDPALTIGILNNLYMFYVSVSPRPQSLPWHSNLSALLWWSSALLWWSSAPSALTWWSSAPPWLPALLALLWLPALPTLLWLPALPAPPWLPTLPALLWLLGLSTPPWTHAPLFHSLPLFRGAGPQLCNIYIYIYAFSRRFYPKRLTVHSGYTFIISMCVPWELNPRPLHC